MGLSASQARLLTITSRKSDCEYESMALSHQKIALSRDMNIISAQYQDALNQTKLVYDFYGNGDKGLQLSYGLLMQPSELNEYRPSVITDQAGRVVLSPELAAAAQAAGIPHEGLGSTPSSDIRNRFIAALANNGAITKTTANNIQNIQYNANAGLGDINMITYSTKNMSLNDFIDEYLKDVKYDFSSMILENATPVKLNLRNLSNGTDLTTADEKIVSFQDILKGHYGLYGITCDHVDMNTYGGKTCAANYVAVSEFWNTLFDALEAGIDMNDTSNQAALNYAKQEILKKVVTLGDNDFSNFALNGVSGSGNVGDADVLRVTREHLSNSYGYIGHIRIENHNHSGDDYNDGYAIDLTNMAKAFFTYFAMYKEGLTTTEYKVANRVASSNLVDFDNFAMTVVEDVDTSGNNLLISNFYDMMFNQIAMNGWVTNENVRDNAYLAEMLHNGSMFLSTVSDDAFYYQSNYATNQYIKEITDEDSIAIAEAKYLREKEKIQSKENIIDMKMKNLDTEITALNTEYNTVKGVISNNVKSSFTRYDA